MSLPPSRLPRFDVYRQRRVGAASSTVCEVNDVEESALIDHYAAWLLHILNSDEACFLLTSQSGERRTVIVEKSKTVSLQLINYDADAPPPTDFSLVLGQEPVDPGPTCTLLVGIRLLTLTCADTPRPAVASLLQGLASRLGHASPSHSSSSLNHPLQTPYPIFMPQDRRQDNHKGYEGDLLHSAFERRATESPNAPALEFLEGWAEPAGSARTITLTYAELDRRAARLAHLLRRKIGAKAQAQGWPGSVPLFLGPSVGLYISILACLKAGLAFSPLALDAPPERLNTIILDQAAPLVLYSQSRPHGIGGDTTEWLDVSSFEGQMMKSEEQRSEVEEPNWTVRQNDLAYILYTSGSTGVPKGVQITHSSAATSMSAHAQAVNPPLDPQRTRWFQFAAPTFDPSVMEIFVTLATGGTLCSARRSLTLQDVNRTVNELGATIMMATPSLATLLRRERVPKLKSLWTMGEALNDAVVDAFAKEDGSCSLYNAYGPTEAAVNCTLLKFSPGFRGSILGPALASCSLFVVDVDSLAILPQGLAGELVIGGPQVSQLGYLRRPKDTQAAFIEAPHLGGRVYRTGDAARVVWSDQGQPWIEILGRIGTGKRQVKIHGQRVELGEVESCLLEAVEKRDRVRSVRALVRSSGSLAAFVEIDDDGTGEGLQERLRAAASNKLPPFARPQAFVISPRRFLSASGKLDARAMLAFVEEEISKGTLGDEVNSTEDDIIDNTGYTSLDRLIDAVRSVTGARVGPSSTMTASGLDSLGAMRLLDMVRNDEILSGLTLRDLVGEATLLQVIQAIEQRRHRKPRDEIAKQLASFDAAHRPTCQEQLGTDVRIEAVLPVTATQAGILASFVRSSNRAYVHHFCYRLSPDVDLDRLQRAAKTVFSSCEAFRSTFVAVDDEHGRSPFAQCVLDEIEHDMERVTVDSTSDDSHDHVVREALDRAQSAIRLERPGFKQHLVLGPSREERTWTLTILHAIFDGGSLQLLLHDIYSLYKSEYPTLNAYHHRTGPKYAVEAYFEATTQHAGEATKAFWEQELIDYEVESFPSIHGLKRQVAQSRPQTGVCEHRATLVSLKALRSTAARFKIGSPLALVQLAWSLVLCAYSKTAKTDVVFGSVVSNRLDAAARTCISPTFTTIPVRVQLGGVDGRTEPTMGEAVAALAAKASAALAHAQPALQSIVTKDGKLPYDSLVALQLFESQEGTDQLWIEEWSPAMTNDFAVMLEIWPGELTHDSEAPLRLRATYKASVLDEQSCDVMLRQFAAILAVLCSVGSDPEKPLSSLFLEMQSDNQSLPLLSRIGSRPRPEEPLDELLLHYQFEQHARQRPDDMALVFQRGRSEYTRLTYGELDSLASRLALQLAKLLYKDGSYKRDAVVPLYANKSVEMYIAVLGILKAGAAWCPIEPTLPAARKVGLLQRTEANIVVRASLELGERDEFEAVMKEAGMEHVVEASSRIDNEERGDSRLLEHVVSSPSHLAYLIWTSGTTGLPKGVLVEHEAASRAMRALHHSIPSCSQQRPPFTINFSAFTFDVFVQDLFYTWGLGGAVVGAPRRVLVDVDGFSSLAAETKATHTHLTPAFGACLPRTKCPSLEVITMIGEKLTEEVAISWQGDDKDGSSAWNTYGPAENAVVSTYRSFMAGHTHQSHNVGWPLEGVTCLVVRPVPGDQSVATTLRGGTGELALGGGQVARGYLGDAKRTGERFVEMANEGRVYLTGDVVRMLADGSLDFVGRRDDLVKLGGIRVELSEISHAISHCHVQVQHVETLYIPRSSTDKDATKLVVSFLLVPDLKSSCDDSTETEIVGAAKAEACRTLPSHMHPARYLVVDSIPRSTSAKTDTKALAAIFYQRAQDDIRETNEEHHDEEGGETVDDDSNRALLAKCVAEVVGLPNWRKVRGSLRALGLDSIRTIRLALKIRQMKRLQTEVAAFDVMRCETFDDLVDVVLSSGQADKESGEVEKRLKSFEEEWRGEVPQLSGLDDKAVQLVLPTTLLQASLLVETAKDPSAYWSTSTYLLEKEVNPSDLKAVWQQVARETEVLRTTFVPAPHGFVQCVLRPDAVDELVEWGEVDAEGVQEAMARRASAISRSRSAARPLYWALTLVKDRHLVIHMHHALYDGTAFDLILASVASRLLGDAIGIKRSKGLTQLREALLLSDATALAWPPISSSTPVTHWEPLMKSHAPRCRPWSLPDLTAVRNGEQGVGMHTRTAELRCPSNIMVNVARKTGLASSALIVQAAFGCLVADYLEQGAVLIGTTLSERGRNARLEEAVAPLVVTVPFVIDGGRRLKKQDGDEEADANAEKKTAGDLLRDLASQWKACERQRHVSARIIRQALGWTHDQALYPALFVVHESQNETGTHTEEERKLWAKAEAGKDEPQLAVEHDLALNVYLDPEGHPHKLVLSASSNFLSAEHTEILVRQVEAQVRSMIEAFEAQTPLCHLPLASSEDQRLLSIQPPIYVDEHTAAAPSRHPCYWLRKHAIEHPEWPAAEELLESLPDEMEEPAGRVSIRAWSYAELDERSDRLASLLAGQSREKHKRGPAVGVCMHRTLEAFAVVLAIFKAGCVYLPIAEDLPEERKRTLIEDSGAVTVFVSDDDLASSFEGQRVQIIRLNAKTELPQQRSNVYNNHALSTGYLLYTSGSTGKPKGVAVSGSNLSSYVEGYAAILAKHSPRSMTLSGKGRYLNLASRAFDPHLSQMFMSWRMGYAATTGPRPALLEDLPRTVRLLNITHMGLLPSLLEHAGMTPDTTPSLAVLGVGGEKVTPFVLDEWARPRKDGPLVVNLYGPTETTIGCTLAVVTPRMASRNIGFPIGASYSVVLLPGTDTVARRGQAGELCLAGDLVAHGGYHGRAANDQGGFAEVSLPQLSESLVKLYRTGDMVQMLDDGSLSFLGRADEQIKIRGQRLELAEVNAVVRAAAADVEDLKQGQTQEAVTIYTKHPSLPQPRLFTVLGWGAKGDSTTTVNFFKEPDRQVDRIDKQISARCADTLPSFMVPTLVIVKDGLPKLPSGKIDVKKVTKALQEVEVDVLLRENLSNNKQSTHSSTEAARTMLSEAEKQVLSTILALTTTGKDRKPTSPPEWVRPTTSIFELGVDSLSAVGLVVRLRRAPHLLDVSVQEVLQRDTLEELAQLPKQGGSGENTGTTLYDPAAFDHETRTCIANQEVEWFRPATPLQEALVALSTLARQRLSHTKGGNTTLPYVHHLTVASPPGVELQEVEQIWQEAVKAEPMLRTCFQDGPAGTTVQAVLNAAHVVDKIVSRVDDGSPLDRLATSINIVDEISTTPALRIRVQGSSLSRGPRAHISIHHSLYDGWTLPRLIKDAYSADSRYRVMANNVHDAQILEGVARCQGQQALRFWTTYLHGYRCSPRKPLRQSESEERKQGQLGKIKMRWTGSLLANLKHVSQKKHRTTIAVVIQSCLAIVVAKKLGVCDVLLGNVISGRGGLEEQGDAAANSSRMPCLATVPVRHCLRAVQGADLDGAVAEAKMRTAQVTPWAHTSLRTVQGIASGTSRRSLFEVLFSYDAVTAPEDAHMKGQEKYNIVNDDEEQQGNIDYPLVLDITQRGQENIEATLAFSMLDVGSEAGHGLAAQLELLLEIVSRGQNVSLAELGIVDAGSEENQDERQEAEARKSESRPLTALEKQARDTLIHVVKDVDASDVGPYTNFYRVGLDSITAIRFARELRRKSDFAAIDATKVLASGSLAVLCGEKEVKAEQNGSKEPDSRASLSQNETVLRSTETEVEIPKKEDDIAIRDIFRPLSSADELEAWYPCTPLQAGMLTLSHGTADSAYRQAHKLRLRDGVDLNVLHAAWDKVVERNDVLRTTFHLVENEGSPRWVAIVHRTAPLAWRHGDSASNGQEEFSAVGFDERPPVSVDILMSAAGTTVIFHLHHALYDGVSLPMIFNQLRTAYHGVPPPALTTPFHVVAKRQASTRSHDEDYWSKILVGYQYAPLRLLQAVPQDQRRWHAKTRIDSDRGLAAACRSLGVTLHAVCTLAYARVLGASLLGRRDVCFGHVLAGRSGSGQEQIVGPLFNTVARRVCLESLLDSNSEAATRVQRSIEEGMSRQAASLSKVTALWRQGSIKQRSTRLFDCLFVFHKVDQGQVDETSSPLWDSTQGEDEDDGEEGDDEYEVNVSFVERRDGSLDIFANASQRVLKTVQDLRSLVVDQLQRVVLDILEKPHAPMVAVPCNLSELPLSASPASNEHGGKGVGEDRKLTSDEEAFCDALQDVIKDINRYRSDWRRPSTNVVDVGIDSITAIRLATRCKKRKGVLARITVQMVLRAQTVEAIVNEAGAAHEARTSNGVKTNSRQDDAQMKVVKAAAAQVLVGHINKEDIEEAVPVLAGQMFHLDSWYATGRRFYEAPWVLTAQSEKVDPARLKEAWLRLRDHNVMLRSTFVALPQRYQRLVQVILKREAARREENSGWNSISVDSDEAVEAATKQAVLKGNADACTFFTVPARLTLICGPRQSALVIRLHHAMYDAWSISRVISRLAKLYNGTAVPTMTPALLTTLSRRLLTHPSQYEQQSWWKAHLASSQTTFIGNGRGEKVKAAVGPQIFVRLPCAVADLKILEEKVQRTASHLRLVVILALARTLAHYTTAKDSPTFGFFTAGRAGVEMDDVDIDSVPLLNVLPLSVDLMSTESTTADRIGSIKGMMAQRTQWEQTPLQDVSAWCSGGQPAFDCFLNLLWHGREDEEKDLEKHKEPRLELRHWKGLKESSEYFTSPITHPLANERGEATTALGAELDGTYLPAHKCYLDVRRDEANDCLAFGVKADAGMWAEEQETTVAEEELGRFCEHFALEIRKVVDEL